MSLFSAAKRGEFSELIQAINESDPPLTRERLDRTLMDAVGDKEPARRRQKVEFLLERGAHGNASTPSGVNALHALFGKLRRLLDFREDGPLVARLIAEGADLNQRDPKWGTPLKMLWDMVISEEELTEVYDAVFSTPGLNFGCAVNRKGTPRVSLMEQVRSRQQPAEGGVPYHPEFARRMEDYLGQAHVPGR
ncbi:hypothetical protein [Streptomyces abyssomicinicus]|uniref:hypothetical protein n=1 Tax=Streptomyces abyssomicinicus TaxID=574929 RepID=UPI00124FC5F0|nr:hypothetical protein [Streptomyces abyssomicinicus]